MCVACLTFSALTLFTPVFNPSQPANLQQGAVREIVYTQAPSLSVAQETQAAIATMLEQLPARSDLQLLRQGLQTLQTRLNQAQSNAEADSIIDQELTALEQRVLASPNPEPIITVLREMVLGEPTLQSNQLLLPSQNSRLTAAISPNLIGNNKHWGWLS